MPTQEAVAQEALAQPTKTMQLSTKISRMPTKPSYPRKEKTLPTKNSGQLFSSRATACFVGSLPFSRTIAKVQHKQLPTNPLELNTYEREIWGLGFGVPGLGGVQEGLCKDALQHLRSFVGCCIWAQQGLQQYLERFAVFLKDQGFSGSV